MTEEKRQRHIKLSHSSMCTHHLFSHYVSIFFVVTSVYDDIGIVITFPLIIKPPPPNNLSRPPFIRFYGINSFTIAC